MTWRQHLQELPVHTPRMQLDPAVRARYAEAVAKAYEDGGNRTAIAAYIGCSWHLVAQLLALTQGLSTEPEAQRVEKILRTRIADGTYKVGDVIPSKPRLCVELGVSHPSVVRALNLLTGQGITFTVRGRGTVVVDPDSPPTGSTLRVRRPSGRVETWHRPSIHSQHIRDTVTTRIQDGKYAEGSRIPGTAALAAEFGTTEGTVKYALRALRAQGILTTGANRDGTLVHPSARSRIAGAADDRDGTEVPPKS
ncbi:GntR family transcriptional regulator [Streptomyces sp. NPDC001073]